jgi:phosphohistidine phosphatase
MLRFIHALPARCGHAMLVGHNPGIHSLAVTLSGDGEADAMFALKMKFPTAALAVIEFEGGWGAIAQGAGYLRLFMVPRELP